MEKWLSALSELFFDHYNYGRGMLEKMDDLIKEGEMFLAMDAVSGLLEELKHEWCPELTVNNALMSPVSVYKEGRLEGIARNAEALMSVQNQISESTSKATTLFTMARSTTLARTDVLTSRASSTIMHLKY